jgi:hypothetical protein
MSGTLTPLGVTGHVAEDLPRRVRQALLPSECLIDAVVPGNCVMPSLPIRLTSTASASFAPPERRNTGSASGFAQREAFNS